MRSALLGLFVVALLPALRAQQPARLDQPVRGDFRIDDPRTSGSCAGGIAVAQIGMRVSIPTGFENTRDCWLGPHGPAPATGGEVLTGMSARQALDHLMTLMPAYSWRDVGGVIVVRPRDAWDDPSNVLNLPTGPFEAPNVPLDQALHLALRAVTPAVFFPHEDVRPRRPIDGPVTVAFGGGTLLDAINALARTRPGVDWELGYDAGRATIALNGRTVGDGGVTAPVRLPTAAR